MAKLHTTGLGRAILNPYDQRAKLGLKQDIEALLSEATLRLNYADNRYRVYEGLAGMADKTFAEAQTFTRGSDATGLTATGRLATVGSNLPRLVGNRGGLLIEGAATNLLVWSEDFTQSAWGKQNANVTVTPSTDIAPDGTQTASTIDFLADNTSLFQNVAVSAGAYTGSMHIKGTAGETVYLYCDAPAGGTNSRQLITLTGAWQRVPGTLSAAAAGTGVIAVRKQGTTANQVKLWRAQFESGSVATSPIKTEGAQATRAADVCSRTLGAEYNPSEGTIYWEAVAPAPIEGVVPALVFSDGTTSNRISLFLDASASAAVNNQAGVISIGGVSVTVPLSVPYIAGNVYKVGLSISKENIIFSVNGQSAGATNTLGNLPIVNTIGSNSNLTRLAATTHRDIAYFPRALTESEMIALTTL